MMSLYGGWDSTRSAGSPTAWLMLRHADVEAERWIISTASTHHELPQSRCREPRFTVVNSRAAGVAEKGPDKRSPSSCHATLHHPMGHAQQKKEHSLRSPERKTEERSPAGTSHPRWVKKKAPVGTEKADCLSTDSYRINQLHYGEGVKLGFANALQQDA